LALVASVLPAAAQDAPVPAFSSAELRRVISHGPWPPALVKDRSNRVSGNPDAIAFGRQLFSDPRLSRAGKIACASCHRLDRGLADGLPRGFGLAISDRNTPSVANVGGQRWYGWDGAHDNLWAQSLRPLLESREMGGDLAHVATTVRESADLREQYRLAFGSAPGGDDERVAVDVAKAVAAWQETLVTARTPFDELRDALARGDAAAAARYPAAARRGLAIFVGRGNCSVCHTGPRFSNGEFHDIGVPFFVEPGRVDPGRHEGIRKLQASRYNLLGLFSDDPARSTATSTRHVSLEHRNFGEFKVPSLRNVARTAPYMHNGSLKTLRDVVLHYSSLDEDRLHTDGERILKPLGLTEREVDDLVAFLESLSASASYDP
jgi:cytochrome c peroxidase